MTDSLSVFTKGAFRREKGLVLSDWGGIRGEPERAACSIISGILAAGISSSWDLPGNVGRRLFLSPTRLLIEVMERAKPKSRPALQSWGGRDVWEAV